MPAGEAVTLVERLAVHHEEEPAARAAGQLQAGLEVRLIGVIGGQDEARSSRQGPQHVQVERFEVQPIPPVEVESEEHLDRPDDPPPGLGRSKARALRHAPSTRPRRQARVRRRWR